MLISLVSLLLLPKPHVLWIWLPWRDLKSVSGFTDTGYLLVGIWEIHGRCLTRNPRSGILGVVSKWLKTTLVDLPGDRKILSIGLVDSKPHSFFPFCSELSAPEWVYGRMEFYGIHVSGSELWVGKNSAFAFLQKTTKMSHPLGGNRVWYRLRIFWIKFLRQWLIMKND